MCRSFSLAGECALSLEWAGLNAGEKYVYSKECRLEVFICFSSSRVRLLLEVGALSIKCSKTFQYILKRWIVFSRALISYSKSGYPSLTKSNTVLNVFLSYFSKLFLTCFVKQVLNRVKSVFLMYFSTAFKGVLTCLKRY